MTRYSASVSSFEAEKISDNPTNTAMSMHYKVHKQHIYSYECNTVKTFTLKSKYKVPAEAEC